MILEGCLGGHDGKGFWNNVEPGSSWASGVTSGGAPPAGYPSPGKLYIAGWKIPTSF